MRGLQSTFTVASSRQGFPANLTYKFCRFSRNFGNLRKNFGYCWAKYIWLARVFSEEVNNSGY
jgi:hypothetical protein